MSSTSCDPRPVVRAIESTADLRDRGRSVVNSMAQLINMNKARKAMILIARARDWDIDSPLDRPYAHGTAAPIMAFVNRRRVKTLGPHWTKGGWISQFRLSGQNRAAGDDDAVLKALV